MKLINIIFLCTVVFMVGCSYDRTNRVVKGFGDSGWVSDVEDAPEPEEQKQQKIAEQAKKQHGLMHIHRYGPGYDILLTLDAGDSDVKFVMALPDGKEVLNPPVEEIAEAKTTESFAEQMPLPDPEENHQKMADRIEQLEKEKTQAVEQTTQHILNAQSLFYKKQYWKALDETNAALDTLPGSAQAHALKGSIYYKMGLYPEAKSSWEHALTLDPAMEQVKASLAHLK